MRRGIVHLNWLVVAALACTSALAGDAVAPTPTPALASVAPASETKSIFERVLALNQIQESDLDADAMRKAYNDLIEKSRAALAGADTPEKKVAALNKTLLGDRQVSYLSNKYWRDASLAASLMRTRGNCLSTSTLYVLIGDALKLPIKMVLVPQHAFVRWDDGETQINIETTAKGVSHPDKFYIAMTDAIPEDIEKLRWCRSLDDNSFLAELTIVAAHHRLSENKLSEALALWEQAEKLAPHRTDLLLEHYQMLADLTGKRSEARAKVEALLKSDPPPPPTVATNALLMLAADAAGRGDHEQERMLLLNAFQRAPKTSMSFVLARLAFCLRALKDFRGAVRYMELAVVLTKPGDPALAAQLYNLAILQKNDGRIPDALHAIREALKINPEAWNLQMLEAGYLVLTGKRDEGLAKFAKIERPNGDVEFFDCMVSWFYAVSKQRDKFYPAFTHALEEANSTHVLEWIDQDVDLDVYRSEAEFKALMEKHAPRLRGK